MCSETVRARGYHCTRPRKDGSVINSARGTEGTVTGFYRRSQTLQPCGLIGRFELNGDMSRMDVAFDTTAYRTNPRSPQGGCGQEPITTCCSSPESATNLRSGPASSAPWEPPAASSPRRVSSSPSGYCWTPSSTHYDGAGHGCSGRLCTVRLMSAHCREHHAHNAFRGRQP